MLGIPTVKNRLIRHSINRWLNQFYEPYFSRFSYGFRHNKNAHQAVLQAQTFLNEGRIYVIELDLEKLFDEVNHDKLMGLLMRKIAAKATLQLIRQYLRSGIMGDGVVSQRIEGTSQGSPLSPLLSNIILDELVSRGYCRVARSPILCTTLKYSYFTKQGYAGFYLTYLRLTNATQPPLL